MLNDGKVSPTEEKQPATTTTKSGNKDDGISLFEKFSFGIAGMSFQIYFSAVGVFTSVFLLNVAKLPPEKNM